MVKQPDIGTYTASPPLPLPTSPKRITQQVAMGATIGAVMWFDDDMVVALRGGAKRDGWSGSVGEDGTTTIALDVMGTHHRWTLTGRTRNHHAAPGRVVHEGVWPD